MQAGSSADVQCGMHSASPPPVTPRLADRRCLLPASASVVWYTRPATEGRPCKCQRHPGAGRPGVATACVRAPAAAAPACGACAPARAVALPLPSGTRLSRSCLLGLPCCAALPKKWTWAAPQPSSRCSLRWVPKTAQQTAACAGPPADAGAEPRAAAGQGARRCWPGGAGAPQQALRLRLSTRCIQPPAAGGRAAAPAAACQHCGALRSLPGRAHWHHFDGERRSVLEGPRLMRWLAAAELGLRGSLGVWAAWACVEGCWWQVVREGPPHPGTINGQPLACGRLASGRPATLAGGAASSLLPLPPSWSAGVRCRAGPAFCSPDRQSRCPRAPVWVRLLACLKHTVLGVVTGLQAPLRQMQHWCCVC